MKYQNLWASVVICVCALWVTPVAHAEVDEKPLTVEGIEAQLLELPWSYEDRKTETPEARKVRANLMARGLKSASDQMPEKWLRRPLVGAAISIWWFETRFGLEIHEGGLSRYGSDDGRAKCFGQIHERSVGIKIADGETMEAFRARQTATWNSLTGVTLEATEQCALATMRYFAGKMGQCRRSENGPASAFGAYGAGGPECVLQPTSVSRYELMSRLAPRL